MRTCEIGVYQGKGSQENKGKGIVGLRARTEKSSDENPAFTQGNDIFVNKKDNKIGGELYDFYNLKSTLVHEKNHKDKGQGFKDKVSDNLDHAQVYFAQVADNNFLEGTEKFQQGILQSMTAYLKDAVVKDDYDDKDIISILERTNKAIVNTGYQLTFQRYSMQPSGININVVKTKKK